MKTSYYFPHDYHARHDPKLERLRMDIGPIGDGIYWDLVEMLYEEGGYLPLKDIPLFAKSLNTNSQIIEKIVKDSKLFIINCDKFYSESLLARLKHINAKRRKAKTSGRIGGLANAKRTLSERVAIKESKVNKRNKVYISPHTSDEDFIKSLKNNISYQGIDIDREFGKMDAWLSTRPGKQKTRRFIVNWLNRADKPINTQPKTVRAY